MDKRKKTAKDRKKIEVKILDVDAASLERGVYRSGGRKIVNRSLTKTLVFDHPKLRMRSSGKVLRLRQVGNKVFLSIKKGGLGRNEGPFQKVVESELVVDSFGQAFHLLESLGFEVFRYHEKYRTVFIFSDGVRVEIDEFPKIPPYLVIEADSEEKIKNFLARNSFKMKDTVSFSSTDILRGYGFKDVNVVRFADSSLKGER